MYTSHKPLLGSFVGNYRLEEIVQQRTFGPLFLARQSATKASYLLRFIATDPPVSTGELDRARQFTQQLQTLRHPYIVPILDADPSNTPPFFVYPHIPTRTLNTRVEQVGPLDLATIGRYLDQLAASLEYAHEHNVIHGALTPESVFLQLDGRLAIGDFGVQHILEGAQPKQLAALAIGMADSAAPEQLQGQQASIASDVYGLGAILYYLLTGHPLYAGRTLDEIAYQTLNAPIPRSSYQRPDVPRELDDLLAQSLAKSPGQRLRRPGILANTFHRIVAPRNSHRVPFVESEPQPQALPAEPGWASGDTAVSVFPDSSVYGAENPPVLAPPPPPPSLFPEGVPYPPVDRFKRIRLMIGVVLAVIVVVGGTLTLINRSMASQGATGVAHFFDAQDGHSNGLSISVSGLSSPSSGFHYAAWLVDEKTEQFLPLGQLVAQKKTYILQYQGNAANLLGSGNRIEITTESTPSQVPLGKVALSGTFPPDTLVHLRHLMLSFPGSPGQIGLLVGAGEQSALLDKQAGQLQSAGSNAGCLAQNMLNIVEGKQGAHYQPLSAACQQSGIAEGDGYGLLPILNPSGTGYQDTGYLEVASAHADLVIRQTDVTSDEQSHARLIITALSNVRAWLTTLDGDLQALLKNPSDSSNVAAIVALADKAYYGVGGATNPAPLTAAGAKSGGVLFAYAEGQLATDLPLVA